MCDARINASLRDPRLVAMVVSLVRALNAYFATEVRGWEHVPKEGPFLVVGNHSGGAETFDLAFFLGPWLAERGTESPLYTTAWPPRGTR